MEKFISREGLVVPLDRANVDTDAIIPKQFLKSIKRTGYGPNLFDAWRYRDHGEPGMDNSKRPLNEEFVLNQPRYKGAQILLARKEFGFRCVIAPSFGDIFYNNSFKNGFLPVVLAETEVDKLFYEAASFPGFK